MSDKTSDGDELHRKASEDKPSEDKASVTELVTKYFRVLDERQLDAATLAEVFTVDGEVTRPNGAVTVGPEAIATSHRESMSMFRATQHLTSGFEITLLAGKTATFRVNIVAMHLWAEGQGDPTKLRDENHFLAGGVVTGLAVVHRHGERAEREWRIQRIKNAVTWRTGVGFASMLQLGTPRP